jgi:hypothetical protein
MNVRLGIYEIFSRIVPGCLYIFAVGQVLVILGVIDIDWQVLNNLSLISLAGIIIVAYILSEALDRFALVWFRIFKKKGISTQVLANFKNKHQDKWDITFEDRDLPILIAYIRSKDLELTGEIERHNAISIMLRNVSFGLLLITINTMIMFVFTRNIFFLITSFVLLIFSIIIIRESIKFRQWFYSSILETIIAYRLDLEKIVMPIYHTKNQKTKR